jgi:hypothetical protein
MSHSQIFIRFKETVRIEKAINNTYVEINNYNQKYNEKIHTYMSQKAQQFLNYHNKNLEYNESQIYTLQFLPRYIFLVFLTKTNLNHPYLLYVNLDSNILNFLIPLGKEQKQIDINDYIDTIATCNTYDLSAIYILLDKTIYIRKYATLNLKFNLLDCNNISNCIKKMHEIDKQRISSSQKYELKNKYNTYYINKAIDILKKYFDMLDAKDYDEAQSFLKGDESRYKSKYFGKVRLNTFFKNTKNIIGHLEIFIVMYELLHQARMRLLKY